VNDDPDPSAPESTSASGDDVLPPVQHCPFCGESIGSFWGRRGDDGSHWCEACQRFFRVVDA
jgi:hypothetical protein